MFITQQPLFKKFWYPVIPIHNIKEGPASFVLLGTKLVLWLNELGEPCSAVDCCAHRSAQLSKGWVCEGHITCPYHGWSYNKEGKCVDFNQGCGIIPASYKIETFKAKEKYGYVWVCLDEPIIDIPAYPEALMENYRLVECFYETWNTTSLRVVENELDMAHFAVVHRNTFGNPAKPLPLSLEIKELDDYRLNVHSELSVCVPEQQQKNTHEYLSDNQRTSTRLMDVTWTMPFNIKLSIRYPNGLHHVIINNPTPIDDNHIQVVQFCFRSDSEAEVSREDLIKFERKILDEDRLVLETTDYNYPLFHEYAEVHMPTDKAGILVRKKIKKMIDRYT